MTSEQEALPGCWWHPNRETRLRCVRCDRPACPDCLREASVGYQCIDCVNAARQHQRAQATQYRKAGYGTRTVAGARMGRQAVIVPLLIGLNALVYVITAVESRELMENYRNSVLFREGVLWPQGVALLDEWWRLFTSAFLHYGLIHLGMNMLALWILGRDLELLLGKARFAALYFVSLLGGSAAVFAFGAVETPTAGASGAVYGLLGALLVAVLRLRLNPTFAIGIIVLNLVLSVTIPNISLLGHVGGLVVGALVMIAMVYSPEQRRNTYQIGAVVLLVVVLTALIVYRDVQLGDQLCRLYPGPC